MSEEKQATPGAEFFNLMRSPMKLIECIDHPNFNWNKGDSVTVAGGNGKLYGPYILDEQFARGNGKIVFKAFSSQTGARTKPMTKAELEQALANLIAENEALKGNKIKK